MQKFEKHQHDQTLVQLQETMQVATTLQTEIQGLREGLLSELQDKVTQCTQEVTNVQQELAETTTLLQSQKAQVDREVRDKVRQGVLAWKSQMMSLEPPDSPERSDAAPAAAAATAPPVSSPPAAAAAAAAPAARSCERSLAMAALASSK